MRGVVVILLVIAILFASALVYFAFRNTRIFDLNTSFKLNYINTCKSFEYLMKANRTGKVFCCPGPIGYSVTSGRIVPGDSIDLLLYLRENKCLSMDNVLIKVHIYYSSERGAREVYTSGVTINELKTESKIFSYRALHEGCYLILVEAIHNGEVIDAFYSSILSRSVGETGAIIRLDKDNYCMGEVLRAEIINVGSETLTIGNPCISIRLMKYVDNEWVKVEPLKPMACTLEEYVLTPGSTHEFIIDLSIWSKYYNLTPGRYRLIAYLTVEVSGEEVISTIDFTISECK
mgnify:CR=1 FL=1